jgi:hypothetical protein
VAKPELSNVQHDLLREARDHALALTQIARQFSQDEIELEISSSYESMHGRTRSPRFEVELTVKYE